MRIGQGVGTHLATDFEEDGIDAFVPRPERRTEEGEEDQSLKQPDIWTRRSSLHHDCIRALVFIRHDALGIEYRYLFRADDVGRADLGVHEPNVVFHLDRFDILPRELQRIGIDIYARH